MTIVNEKHLLLEFDEDLQCIIQTWKGYSASEKFRAGIEKTNNLFRSKKPVRKFIVDGTEAAVVKQEDTEWAAKNAIPIAVQNGLKFYALVVPKNIFSQISLEHFKKGINQPTVEVKVFDDIAKAKQWMGEMI